MPRLVHLAPASSARSIQRSGVRGTRWEIPTLDGPVLVRQAVFAMPVVQDFARAHQWVREPPPVPWAEDRCGSPLASQK